MTLMHPAVAGMISATLFLLADAQSFFLVGRDQAFALLHGPMANLPRLLISLLRRERRVGADRINFRARVAGDGVNLLHDRLFNTSLLKARFSAASRRPVLRRRIRGRVGRGRSALGEQREGASKQDNRTQNRFQHDGDPQKIGPCSEILVR